MDKEFKTTLNIKKSTLKNIIGVDLSEQYDKMLKNINDNIYNSIFKQLKESEPDTPDEYIHEFIKNFVEVELSTEYDVRTREYNLIATPLINWNKISPQKNISLE